MIVSEFAKKYNVPKALVYEVSFATDTRMATPWVTDVPENELAECVMNALEKRIEYHRQKTKTAEEIMEKLKKQLEN